MGRHRGSGFLHSIIFFRSLVSSVAEGVTFSSLMHPTFGIINKALAFVGIPGPDWLGDPHLALLSVSLVDVWRGVGMATVIYIAGIRSIPRQLLRGGQDRWSRPHGQGSARISPFPLSADSTF